MIIDITFLNINKAIFGRIPKTINLLLLIELTKNCLGHILRIPLTRHNLLHCFIGQLYHLKSHILVEIRTKYLNVNVLIFHIVTDDCL